MARRNTHFRRRFNASGPLERVLTLIVLVAIIGMIIGLLLPQISSGVAEITGSYTTIGSATDTSNMLVVDDNQSSSGYDRDSFGLRTTNVGDSGCGVRDNILAHDLADITYKRAGFCMVKSGTLADSYTAQATHFVCSRATSAKVQTDHVAALGNAWQPGAYGWSTTKRHESGNDPCSLLVVGSLVSWEKGSASAAYWLPTNADYRYDYATHQIGTRDGYQLTATSQGRDVILTVLHACPDQTVSADK